MVCSLVNQAIGRLAILQMRRRVARGTIEGGTCLLGSDRFVFDNAEDVQLTEDHRDVTYREYDLIFFAEAHRLGSRQLLGLLRISGRFA